MFIFNFFRLFFIILFPLIILTCDSGESESPPVSGCMDQQACNFDENALIDDNESCEYCFEEDCNTYPAVYYDCEGTCIATLDNCDVCDDDPDNNCIQDCAGEWGGSLVEVDECGVCNGSGIPEGNCDCVGNVEDCAGVCGGIATEDNCGVCDDDTSNNCTQDCNGEWGGTAIEDECGVCNGTGGCLCSNQTTSCDCCCEEGEVLDCLNQCNGSAVIDACGVCNGDGIPEGDCDCAGNVYDCAGNCGGSAEVDGCNVCDDDPNNNCEQDCTGQWGGTADEDQCGVCGGNGVSEACQCLDTSGLNENGCCDTLVKDCAGECGGSAELDICGVCNGDGIVEGTCDCTGNVFDCAGNCGGLAEVDVCGICGGTGELNEYGCCGNIELDECGVCDGDGALEGFDCNCNWDGSACAMSDDTFYIFSDGAVFYSSTKDIAGFQFNVLGTNIISASDGAAESAGFDISLGSDIVLGFSFSGAVIPPGCGLLTMLALESDATGLAEIVVSGSGGFSLPFSYYDENVCPEGEYDCACECNGSALLDCNDECNGGAEVDDCGVCNGLNLDLDCEGVCFGDAIIDGCGVCNGPGYHECNDGTLVCDPSNCEIDCGSCEVDDFEEYGSECCDTAWLEGYDCNTLIIEYGWDCTGCECPGNSEPICGDGTCSLWIEDYENCPDDCVADCLFGINSCPIEWIGDGECDNIFSFAFTGCDLTCYACDGGDCGESNEQGDDCDISECDENGGISIYISDGDCDLINNNEICGYDGGDCCPSTCIDGQYTCTDQSDTSSPQYTIGWEDAYYCYDPNSEECGDESIYPDCGDTLCNCGESYEVCPDDCLAPGECEQGFVPDCSGDGDCCPESWIGDGWVPCDDANQPFGCDLSCYDNDGGDCNRNRNSSGSESKTNKKSILFKHQKKNDAIDNSFKIRQPKRIN